MEASSLYRRFSWCVSIACLQHAQGVASALNSLTYFQMPPVDQPESSISELIEFQHGRNKLDGQPMSVVAACGPYTIDDDLHYAPLAALLDEMTDLRPDLLILVSMNRLECRCHSCCLFADYTDRLSARALR